MFNLHKSSTSATPLFIVEGNIGAGKSTFLQLLASHLMITPIFEPCDKWQQEEGNLLEKFYQDTRRWAYTFQNYAFISRIMATQQAARTAEFPLVLERSVYSDRYCFAKNCFESGLMTKLEWEIYQEWFSWLVEQYRLPDGFIYLQVDPEVCYERTLLRKREEEVGIEKSYLDSLHKKHEQWLVDKKEISKSLQNVPVLVLQCNADFEHNSEELLKQVKRVAEFFGLSRKAPVSGQFEKKMFIKNAHQ